MNYSLPCYSSALALVLLATVLQAKPTADGNIFNNPLSFIENKGQVADQYYHSRKDIDFKLQGKDITLFVGDGQLHYQWTRPLLASPNGGRAEAPNSITGRGSGEALTYRMDVVLLGANKNAVATMEEPQKDYESYYLPQCPMGVTAHLYGKIIYKDIYPHIDWEIEASPQGSALKYNFIVLPGGDYRNIKIQYKGATALALKDGSLTATTPYGSITENAPYTYDAITQKEITSNFVLNNNVLSYNISFPLGEGRDEATFIIDPTLKWGTYYGGGGNESIGHVADDSAGNVYLLENTSSSNNIATTGAYQQSLNNIDIGLALFDINGVRQWGTYYGGTGIESAPAIKCDNIGNVYIGGSTNSTSGMAGTGGSFQLAAGPGFLAKFNNLGQLQWNSYFNGEVYCMAYDGAGYMYFGGITGSTSGVGTAGTYQPTQPAGSGGGFLEKFTLSGTQVWGSYYGATIAQSGSLTEITSVSCDLLGHVFIGGVTGAFTGIASPGAFQTTFSGTAINFLASFTATGSRLWGTYYNQLASTTGLFVDADGQGNVYAGGSTDNTTGMTTTGAWLTTLPLASGNSGFIAKFNNSGGRTWGTYYGGTGGSAIYNVRVHANGDVYVTGAAAGNNGIATAGAYQTVAQGFNDVFLAAFSSDGSRLKWGTFYGGPGSENFGPSLINYGLSLVNKLNRVYFAGITNSSIGIATPLSHQTSYGGNPDAFLVQFQITDTQVFIQPPFTDTVLCVGDTLHINYGVTYNFRSGNVFTVQLSNASGSFASPITVGTITASGGGPAKFPLPNVPAGIGYRIRIISSLPADTSDDNGINMRLSPYPITPNATANTPICAGQTLNLSSTASSTGVTWGWAGPNSFTASTQNASIPNVQTNGTGDYYITANLNGCLRKDTVSVTANASPAKPNATANAPLCSGQTLTLFGATTTGGVSWSWSGPSFSSALQNPTIANAQPSANGDYILTVTLGSCSSADTVTVTVNQGPALNAYPSPNDTVCSGASVTLVAIPVSAGTGPTYQWYKNGSIVTSATSTSYTVIPSNGDVFYCQMTPGTGTSCTGAVSSNSIPIAVLPLSVPAVTLSGPTGVQDPFNLLTFHATGTSGGSSPHYQWLRNGKPVTGATSDTWSTQGLYLGQHDTICVILTSSDYCATPKTAVACMNVEIMTGVNDINNNTTVELYPNPNDGNFTIHATGIDTKEVQLEIINAIGQTVYKQKATVTKGILHEYISTSNLAAGVYLLKLDGKTMRLVVRH